MGQSCHVNIDHKGLLVTYQTSLSSNPPVVSYQTARHLILALHSSKRCCGLMANYELMHIASKVVPLISAMIAMKCGPRMLRRGFTALSNPPWFSDGTMLSSQDLTDRESLIGGGGTSLTHAKRGEHIETSNSGSEANLENSSK